MALLVKTLQGGNHTVVKMVEDGVRLVVVKIATVAELHHNEVKHLKMLSQSGIAPTLLKAEGLTITMEAFPIGDLMDNFQNFTEADRFSVARQLLDAVSLMHEVYLIVHQDIKPENIVLQSKNGSFVPKLIDFEIAVTITSPEDVATTADKGTFAYFSYEKLTSRPYALVPSELWAVSLVLFILFFEAPPYHMFSGEIVLVRNICNMFHDKPLFWSSVRRNCRSVGKADLMEEFFDTLFQREAFRPKSAAEMKYNLEMIIKS
jgi:serine/threonine protein kinase